MQDPPEKELALSERDAAWLAAVLDCEGWIGTARAGATGGVFGRIGVGNTNPLLTARLLELTGYGFVRNLGAPNKRWKPQTHWICHRYDEVRAILRAVLPHLILKRQQAELVLSLPGLHVKSRPERFAIHAQLHALNRKGPV